MENKKITEEVQKSQDLVIVLNGGHLEMKGATIPVKWYFSKDLALKGPTHILLVDLTEAEASENISYGGRRYLVEVDKAVKFLQFFKSGNHILLAFAFKKLDTAAAFLAKKEENRALYEEPVFVNFAKTFYYKTAILASTKVEFTVPKEVFAKKPESKLGKLFFNYLYWPNSPKPRDECQVKRNAFFLALPKLPFFIFAQLFYAAYLFLASAILRFFGYQSIGLAEIFKRIFSQENNADIFVFGLGKTKARVIYKNGVETSQRTWFSPFHLTGFFAFFSLLLISFRCFGNEPISPGVATVFIVFFILVFAFLILKRFFNEEALKNVFTLVLLLYAFVIGIVFLFFKDTPTTEDKIGYLLSYFLLVLAGIPLSLSLRKKIINSAWYKKQFKLKSASEKNEKKEKIYSDYLLENFTISEDLDLKNLPSTFETNKLKRDLVIRFWSAKADNCKPYES